MFLLRESSDFISRKLLILACFLALQFISFSQTSEPSTSEVNATLPPDSVKVIADTLSTDITSAIFYDAEDSIIYDAINNRFLLYGNGIVKYDDIELKAGYIEYSLEESTVSARGKLDSAGVFIQKPELNQGGEKFNPDSLSFNFKSEKAYISNVVTQTGEFYVLSDVTKRDSTEKIYLGKTKITTCDAPNPHFHFQVGRAALVPEEKGKNGKPDKPGKIVTGPVMLKFRKIPTPLALPFGFFPDSKKRSKGILIPSYGNGFGLGYYLRDLGYYYPINDHIDTRVLVDLYTRGSWAISNQTVYKKRYRSSGRFNIQFSKIKNGFRELSNFTESTDFLVDWSHTLDSKAIPGIRFSSSVRVGTSTNFRNNLNSSQTNFLTNTYSSSINTSKSSSLLGVPTNYTLNLRHSQNTSTGVVSLTLPQFTIQMNRAYPFKSKKVGAKGNLRKAIEGIGITNTGNFETRAVLNESEIRLSNLSSLTDDFKSGYRHQFNASTSLKLGVLSVNPSLSFSSNIYRRVQELSFNTETLENQTDTLDQLNATYNWSTGISATTKFFGTFTFRNAKKLKAIRHTVTPSVGFSFSPITGEEIFGFIGTDGEAEFYDPADFGIFGSATNLNQTGSVNFSLLNNLEMKVADGEGGTKKVSILDRLSLSTRNNLAADSLNWGNLSLGAGTKIGKFINLNYNATYSFYDQNSQGQSINEFLVSNEKFLFRQTSSGGGINLNLTGEDFKRKVAKPSDLDNGEFSDVEILNEEEVADLEKEDVNPNNFRAPWSMTIAYTLNRRAGWDTDLGRDTFSLRQGIILRGNLSLGENWSFTAQSGLDLTGGRPDVTSSSFSIYRSLHCWEFSANVIPFGDRRSYTLSLNVKASALRDLKIDKRGVFDGDNGFLF